MGWALAGRYEYSKRRSYLGTSEVNAYICGQSVLIKREAYLTEFQQLTLIETDQPVRDTHLFPFSGRRAVNMVELIGLRTNASCLGSGTNTLSLRN